MIMVPETGAILAGNTIVTPEQFGAVGNDYDLDTAAWQSAIDYVVEKGGGTVKASLSTYMLKPIFINNSGVVLDFNGAHITTDLRDQDYPMIFVQGSQDEPMSIDSVEVGQRTINVPTGRGVEFAPNDIIRISDSGVTLPWNYGLTPDPGITVVGRSQMNWVEFVTGDVITLSEPCGIAFDTIPLVRKENMLNGIEIKNIKEVNEIDPGAPYSGDTQYGPHIIALWWCDRAYVHDVCANGFQLHVVDVRQCTRTTVERVSGIEPFRPQYGGHGYTVRFDGCAGCFALNNYGQKVRHHIDDSASFDTTSAHNFCVHGVVSAYKTHGTGSYRYTSYCDRHVGGSSSTGWEIGNLSYRADYDVTIISPRAYGGNYGIMFSTCSENLTVIDAQFQFITGRDIAMWAGAKNLVVKDSTFINGPTKSENILVRSKVYLADSYGLDCTDVSISGCSFLTAAGPSTQNLVVVDALGTILIESNDIKADQSNVTAFAVGQLLQQSNIFIRNNNMIGSGGGRLMRVYQAPTTGYYITDNNDLGAARSSRIAVSSNLIMQNNNEGTGTYVLDGSFSDAVTGGAKFINNLPSNSQIPPVGRWENPDRLNTYSLWVQASGGKLMIKSGFPSSDSDGTVVGTQT